MGMDNMRCSNARSVYASNLTEKVNEKRIKAKMEEEKRLEKKKKEKLLEALVKKRKATNKYYESLGLKMHFKRKQLMSNSNKLRYMVEAYDSQMMEALVDMDSVEVDLLDLKN